MTTEKDHQKEWNSRLPLIQAFQFNWKLDRMASPSLRVASIMLSGVAAANVARKNSPLGSASWSAINQEPAATRTPLSMQSLNISASISDMLMVEAHGCLV